MHSYPQHYIEESGLLQAPSLYPKERKDAAPMECEAWCYASLSELSLPEIESRTLSYAVRSLVAVPAKRFSTLLHFVFYFPEAGMGRVICLQMQVCDIPETVVASELEH